LFLKNMFLKVLIYY